MGRACGMTGGGGVDAGAPGVSKRSGRGPDCACALLGAEPCNADAAGDCEAIAALPADGYAGCSMSNVSKPRAKGRINWRGGVSTGTEAGFGNSLWK